MIVCLEHHALDSNLKSIHMTFVFMLDSKVTGTQLDPLVYEHNREQ
jgi:hypothetical protein